jgi:predicted DCC family thiol-disulfide oxidoreductase YuxK
MIDREFVIFYDAQCRLCQRSRRIIDRLHPTTAIRFIDANDSRELARYPAMRGVDARGQMHVLDPAGRLTGGYDALVSLIRTLPVLSWAYTFLGLAPIRALGRRIYRWVAKNRYRLGGQVSCHEGACQMGALNGR